MKTTNNTELSNLQVSIRALSELTGLHRDVIRGSIGRANLTPTGNRGGYPSYSLKSALSAVLSRRGDADPESLSPVDRRAVAQAKILEHQLLIKNGEYLPRGAYRDATAQSFARCASSIRSIPDNLERRLGLSPMVPVPRRCGALWLAIFWPGDYRRSTFANMPAAVLHSNIKKSNAQYVPR